MQRAAQEKSLQYAAQQALAIQSVESLSTVLAIFGEVTREVLWPEAVRHGYGTEWVTQHAITTVFLDRLCALNGLVTDANRVRLAYTEVKAINSGE